MSTYLKLKKSLFILSLYVASSFFNTNYAQNINTINEPAFNTNGLYFAEFYDLIFRGHFEKVQIKRDDSMLISIIEEYMQSYGRQCDSYLPTNKVELPKSICVREQVTTDGYGFEISRTCIEWKTIGSGIYAKPKLYNAKQTLLQMFQGFALNELAKIYSDPNAIGNSVDMAHKYKGLKNDMLQIFVLNSCNSEGILRFEENLVKFIKTEKSIRINTESNYTRMKTSGGPTGKQNFHLLADHLIADQSKTWMMNRYNPSNILSISTNNDASGKPISLKAIYKYSSFGGNYEGWAKIVFKNGLPNCIYFHDFPANCKKPNSSILANYAAGKYSKN